MPKGILVFNLPEENEEFAKANKAQSLASAIFQIRQEVFRPARKHGYQDEKLQKLTDRDVELISNLEELFNKVLEENGVLDES